MPVTFGVQCFAFNPAKTSTVTIISVPGVTERGKELDQCTAEE